MPKEKRSNQAFLPLKRGLFVWAQIKKNDWWPAIIIKHCDAGLKSPTRDKVHVFWFGDHRVSEVLVKNVIDFKEQFKNVYNQRKGKASKTWKKGVSEAVTEIRRTYSVPGDINEALEWALDGFELSEDLTNSVCNTALPNLVQSKLIQIKERNIEDMEDDRNKPSPKISVAIEAAIILDQPTTFCFGCYSEEASEEHPLFTGQMCKICIVRLQKTLYSFGEDGIGYCCTVCGFKGDMIVCSSNNCGRSYCKICIENLCKAGTKEAILARDEWICFLCKDQKSVGLIQAREDWKNKVYNLLNIEKCSLIRTPNMPLRKKRLRVLSLFDGIATGFLALNALQFDVENYFACEIDEDAIRIARHHFGGKINFIGRIEDLSEAKLKTLLPIDLLIGGSPCNDLSKANPNRKGLYDVTGTGILFFEFYRVLCTLRANNDAPFFWLFENVASMAPESKLIISRFLQCEPSMINAATMSPQQRARFFWGNLPSLQSQQPDVDGPELNNFLMNERIATVGKLRTITTRANSLLQGPNMIYPVLERNRFRDKLWITEMEIVFGLPLHYTDVGNISVTKRQELIGKSWSVQVITSLFHCLSQYYRTRKDCT